MDEFLSIAFAFPTLAYTVLVVASMIYWVVGMIGLVDADLGLDGAAGAEVDGAVDGAMEAAGGKIDAVVEGAAEAAEGVDGDAGGFLGSLVSLLSALRLRNAPLTITASVLSLCAWVFAYLGTRHVAPLLPGPALVGQLVVLFGALVPAVPLTSLLTKPLAGVFAKNEGRGKRALLGHTAKVRIAADVGERAQVRVRIGGDDLLLRVRAETALPKDADVLLVDYDAKSDTFVVEPMSEVLDAGRSDPQR